MSAPYHDPHGTLVPSSILAAVLHDAGINGHPYNVAPAGFTEISLAELGETGGWREYGLSGVYSEFRQIILPGKPAISIHMVWYWDGTGIGFAPIGEGEGTKIYRWGCQHEFVQHSHDGNCLNTYRCTKCGHLRQVDSSD